MSIGKLRAADVNSQSKEYGELSYPVDHHIARYVIRNKRAISMDGGVVKLITERGPNKVTHLFGASPEKAKVLMDELEESCRRDNDVMMFMTPETVMERFLTATDKYGNTALFGANPETAKLIIAKLGEVSSASKVWEFMTHKNIYDKTAFDEGKKELVNALGEASTCIMQNIHRQLRV